MESTTIIIIGSIVGTIVASVILIGVIDVFFYGNGPLGMGYKAYKEQRKKDYLQKIDAVSKGKAWDLSVQIDRLYDRTNEMQHDIFKLERQAKRRKRKKK